MRDKIARLAKANDRSINAEIIDRLEKSMVTGDTLEEIDLSLRELYDRIEKLETKFSYLHERINVTASQISVSLS
jgi:uncharacterized coiled-coil DUF342 family protein